MILFGVLQATSHKFDFISWGLDPAPGFLLERMQHIHGAAEANGINSPVGISVGILCQLKDTAAKTGETLGRGRMLPALDKKQLEAERFLHGGRNCV